MKTLITTEMAISILIAEFPQFKIDSISEGLPYIIAAGFAHYLLEAQKAQRSSELEKAANLIESLHVNGAKETRELATIGFLEGIQNVWGNSGTDPHLFYDRLGPESKKWWRQLNKFWKNQIRYVGETIDTER